MLAAWKIRLTAAAEADFAEIVQWTVSEFGTNQGRTYSEAMREAIGDLAQQGPDTIGAQERDDIRKGIRLLHVARKGRKGCHLIIYRVSDSTNAPSIEILRILHDAMDLQRHL